MGTMAASAAGSLAGNAIANTMFGNSGEQQPPQQQQPQQMQQQSNMQQQYGASMCGPQMEAYNKCVEANQGNVNNCLWAWDMVSKCKMSNNEM